jgi:GNAT superfamily N-acetyltransferase
MTGALESNTVQVMPLEPGHLPAVIELHRSQLPYTVNSILGREHLAFLYRVMGQDPDSTILVALVAGKVAGVVSATLDPGELKRRIFAGLTPGGWVRLFFRLLRKPRALLAWYAGQGVEAPVSHQGTLVNPCLTAIAVDGSYRQAGIGRALVAGVEEFCRSRGYRAFRLDTVQENEVSRKFYQRLGFVEAEQRGGNVMLVKVL